MNTFPLTVVTPDGVVFEGEAESLLVRTTEGDVQIMAGHADTVAALGTGRAALRVGGRTRYAAVSGGFVTVEGGRVTAVAVTVEYGDAINVERAERAKAAAEQQIREAKDDASLDRAKAKLARALARLQVADM